MFLEFFIRKHTATRADANPNNTTFLENPDFRKILKNSGIIGQLLPGSEPKRETSLVPMLAVYLSIWRATYGPQ